MPVYTYRCDACQREFDVTQRMSDAPITECECGEKGHVHRLISAGAGLIFKGSGFYQTDYKGSSSSAATKTESPKTESSGHTCGSPNCCHKH